MGLIEPSSIGCSPMADWSLGAGRLTGTHPVRVLTAVVVDVALLGLGLLIAVGLRVAVAPASLHLAPGAVSTYALCGASWIAVMFYEQIYFPGLQEADRTDQLVKALTGGLVAAVLVSFIGHRSYAISRGVIAAWYVANLLLFVLVRPIFARGIRRLGHSGSVLIVGDDSAGSEALCQSLQASGYNTIRAPLAADPQSRAWMGAVAVAICLPADSASGEIVARWERHCGQIGVIPASPLSPVGARPVNLHGVQLFAFQHPLDRSLNRACKRGMDLLGAGLGGLFACPFALLLAVAIRLDSPGAAIYRQRRLGRDGRPIWVLKFRSMSSDAEACLRELLAHDPLARHEFETTFKLKNDPRVTRVGKFIRRYSLDEIPQLWNVFRGDMSLVGPRPIVEAEVAKYGEAYSIISRVRPGLTGVWQTSGRSDVTYESRCRFDVSYVRDWSIWRDLAVLMRTIAAIIAPEAY